MSILNYINEKKLDVQVTLIYSARFFNELVFFDEIKQIMSSMSNIKAHFIVTDETPPSIPKISIGSNRLDMNLLKSK